MKEYGKYPWEEDYDYEKYPLIVHITDYNKNAKSPWITMEEFIAISRNEMICQKINVNPVKVVKK